MKAQRSEPEKRYWRSMQRLLDSPAMRPLKSDEFPQGAAEGPGSLSRRTMLRLMGASFALAGLASCRRPEEAIVPYVSQPENLVAGIPQHYATTMALGTSAYGLLVESHEGRPTKIEGNPLHPSSHGAASSWMQAAILGLYDPDRSRSVLQRPRPGENHQRAAWQDFFSFWKGIAPEFESSGGEGLAVLAEAYSSPTLAALSRSFRERFPKARWVVHEPAGDENIYEGLRLATGQAYRPVYQLEKARVILALDADFLLTESESLNHARGFSSARQVGAATDSMNRLYVVESCLSLTGAMADHRIPLQSLQISKFLSELARELQILGLPLGLPVSSPKETQGNPRALATDLVSSPGAALIIAGRSQPAQVHALVFAINQALGALGRTLSLGELTDGGWPRPAGLSTLAEEMHQGRVSTLVMLGGNPAYDAPVDLQFERALGEVSRTVHLGTHVNETALQAQWHLPQSHFLESWGDARAADGSVSLIQPLIAPLFDSRSSIEVLGVLAGGDLPNGYELVRNHWLGGVLSEEDFESRWRRVLHDGLLRERVPPPQNPSLRPGVVKESFEHLSGSQTSSGGKLEIVFRVSPAVYDGRFANNGWLQELPDPVTRLAWGNAALISPGTASSLGLQNNEVIRLHYQGSAIEVPVLVLPGQADASVALALGYGRSAAGRVGDGVGGNAYRLRRSRALYFDAGVQIEPTGRFESLTSTQHHWEMEGRSLVREVNLSEYRSNPDFAAAPEADLKPQPLWGENDFSQGYQWGMAIDLNACIGCGACAVACQSENNIPIVGQEQVRRGREMHWLRVDRYFSGDVRTPEVLFQPVPCMHCENAPCEEVCPVGATLHDREGINAMIYNRCVGTRYCSNNCPYKVRRFNFFNYTKDLPELVQMAMNPEVTVRSRGVMEKCTYCIQRINRTKMTAKTEGRKVGDGEIQTACQQTCPTSAIVFGNINDPESLVARLKRQSRTYTVLAELNNKPRTSYLAKLRNPNPEWAG
ncbi:MAG: TAT-variant-translocated molybdopterin oxidoreductase [Acidobacteriota bacterium]